MNERRLMILSLVCSITGILALFFISSNAELEESEISEIENKKLYEKVKIRGEITRIQEKNNILVIEIAETKPITVIFFKGIDHDFSKGDQVSVKGELREYNGKYEILGENIETLK
ncbi:MAG: hypothetical protein GY861_14930 [bacterium]|nr:hypothetical protein [bacterium]